MPTFAAESQKQSSGEVLVELIKITHDDLPENIYIAANTENVVSNGNTYLAANIHIKEPEQGETVPRAEVTFGNIGRDMMDLIQEIQGEPTAEVSQVYTSEPDTIVRNVGTFKVKNVTGNLTAVTFELSFSGLSNIGVPKKKFTARDFPGLYS